MGNFFHVSCKSKFVERDLYFWFSLRANCESTVVKVKRELLEQLHSPTRTQATEWEKATFETQTATSIIAV